MPGPGELASLQAACRSSPRPVPSHTKNLGPVRTLGAKHHDQPGIRIQTQFALDTVAARPSCPRLKIHRLGRHHDPDMLARDNHRPRRRPGRCTSSPNSCTKAAAILPIAVTGTVPWQSNSHTRCHNLDLAQADRQPTSAHPRNPRFMAAHQFANLERRKPQTSSAANTSRPSRACRRHCERCCGRRS